MVQASEDCLSPPPPIAFFDPLDDTQLKVIVYVNDVNDNKPVFLREVFTGGISTESDFGMEVMTLLVSMVLFGWDALG